MVGNSATVMFEGTGPSADNVVTEFRILIELFQGGSFVVQEEFMCSSPSSASMPATCTVDPGKST